MMEIKPIGGYFELETFGNGGNFPQNGGIRLNSGRNALEYVLSTIKEIDCLYIPYYTCEVVLEPLKKLCIRYEFYHIDKNLEIVDDISLSDNQYILYTNYYGIKDTYVKSLAEQYGERLIVDCAQALYAEAIPGIKTIYSPRKFVGIPDGGIAYVYGNEECPDFLIDDSTDRMSHLYLRKERGPQAGYADFKANSKKLVMQPIKRMSPTTSEMIDIIDFEEIKARRIRNFRQLHEALKATNKFVVPDIDLFECPMIYPYWTKDESLKHRLISEQIFIATYWPNVLEWTNSEMLEHNIATKLLAIPCDQRYGAEDMNRIIQLCR